MSSIDFCKRPLIITDVETTGLDPTKHEIIEIGAVKVDQDLQLLDVFDWKVRPLHIEINEPEALLVNGYSPEDWILSAYPPDAAKAFEDFSRDGILTAWSSKFEYSFLDAMWRNAGLPNPIEHFRYVFDIPSMVWMAFGKWESLRKDDVAADFGLPPEVKPHRGIGGAMHELAILRAMKGRLRDE